MELLTLTRIKERRMKNPEVSTMLLILRNNQRRTIMSCLENDQILSVTNSFAILCQALC
jgi:hypothetical protein